MKKMENHSNAIEENQHPPAQRGLLAFFALISLITLSLGGWLTALGFGPWYDDLLKPPFQPPGWLFSPAWTILFTLLAVATWRIARYGEIARLALRVYAFQLLFNVLWSLLFRLLFCGDRLLQLKPMTQTSPGFTQQCLPCASHCTSVFEMSAMSTKEQHCGSLSRITGVSHSRRFHGSFSHVCEMVNSQSTLN